MSSAKETTTRKGRSLDRLLWGMALTVGVFLGVPFFFGLLGWRSAPAGNTWWILVAACFAIIVKLVANETATGEFEFYKLGYDYCVTTLVAVITVLAIQLSSPVDLFPGLASMPWPATLRSQVPTQTRTTQLIIFCLIAWLVTWVTARMCRDISEEEDKRIPKAILSAVVGVFLLSLYALLLAAKSN
jgi:hypothetical protein